MRNKIKNLKIKILFLIFMMIMMIVVSSFTNISNGWGGKVNQTGIKLVRNDNGRSIGNYWNVSIDQNGFTGFCIDGGGYLTSRYFVGYDVINLYDIQGSLSFPSGDNWRSAMWLADNGFISMSRTEYDEIHNNALKTQAKENMKELLTGAGHIDAANAIDRLSDEELIAAENCVFWQLCKNTDTNHNNATIANSVDGQNLVAGLRALANAHNTYNHVTSSVNMSKEANFEINTNTRKAGNFKITGVTNVTANDLIIEVNGTNVTGSTVTIVETSNDSVTFNLTLPNGTLKTTAGAINTVDVYCKKAIATEAYILTNGGANQYLLAVRKAFTSVAAKGTDTVNIMDLALVKTITEYELNNGTEVETIDIDRFNPSIDVDTSALKQGRTYGIYNVEKGKLSVNNDSHVTYRLYVFNEGNVSALAQQIVDYIPTCMTVVSIAGNTNPYGQGLCTKDNTVYIDDEGNRYNKIIINSSKFMGMLNGYNPTTDKISYNYVDIKLKVNANISGTEKLVLRNFAEIKTATVPGYTDIDSTPGNLNGELLVNGKGTADFNTKVENLKSYSELYKVDYQRGTKYNFEDDDDFEQIVLVNPEVDLALRKFISSVETKNGNIKNYDSTREPKLYGQSVVDANLSVIQLKHYAQGDTTMEYIHKKDTVTVKKQDKITYKIRVYNEGIGNDYRACATQIIDSLPAGVKILATETKTANDTAGNNWINWSTSQIDGESWNTFIQNQAENGGENSIKINAISSADQTNVAGKGIPDTLKYYSERIIGEDTSYYQEVIIVCQVEDDVQLNTPLINTASIGNYRYFTSQGTAVEVNSSNEETLKQTTITDRDSDITIANLPVTDLVKLATILNDYEYSDMFYVLKFWAEFGSNKLNDHIMIRAVASKILENYASEYQEYVRGLQDDDDFESIIVKETSTLIKIQKVDTSKNPIEGINFNIQLDSETVTKTSDSFGEVEVLPNTTIDSNQFNYATVHKATITEIRDGNGKYISVVEPINLYYAFDENGNIAYSLTGETDYTQVNTEDGWTTFVGTNGAIHTKNYQLADGTTGTVSVNADANEVTIQIENVRITGLYKLNIIKVEDTQEQAPIANTKFTVNNGTEMSTNANGIVNGSNGCTYSITNRGWKVIRIKEVETAGEDYALLKNTVPVYVYTDIVNGQYKVTKVGYSIGDLIDVSSITEVTTKEKQAELEDGRTVTLELKVDPAKVNNEVVTIELIVPNPVVQPGEYTLKIKKVDLDGNSVENVGFTVKYNGTDLNLTNKTDENGFLTVDTKTIDKTNASTIDKYVVSEIEIDNKYVKLNESVEVSVYKAKTYYGYRMIHACFTDGSTTKQATLEDGTAVELNIEYSSQTGEIVLTIPNKKVEYDLALQKFITGVTTGDTTREVTGREPKFNKDITVTEGDGYNYPPEFEDLKAEEVTTNDIVTYTLRIYNEGGADAYAAEIADDIPDGVEFVPYTLGDKTVNDTYRWVMYKVVTDEEIATLPAGTVVKELDGTVVDGQTKFKKCVITTDVKEADYIVSDYLSKEQGEARMNAGDSKNPNLLKAFEPTTQEKLAQGPDYRDVKIQFKVIYKATTKEEADHEIVNYAQITKETDKNGEDITDRDSTSNEWIDTDDDQDREKIKVKYFDLALVKWVSEAIIVEDGVEKVTPGNKLEDLENQYDHRLIYAMYPDTIGDYTDLEPVIKVDIPKSKLESTVVKFKYQIRVYNEGQIDGYVKEITDFIPTGMRFVQEDNPLWTDAGDGKVITTQLADTLLTVGGEPQTVEIIYTWINSENNLGLIVNMAEISQDYNDFDSPDIDSTPNNVTVGEDDIDDAAVLLSVRTGEKVNTTYIILAISTITLITAGVVLIKKFVL